MIIGLTGSLSAGKGSVSDFLKKKGFVYTSLSNELREFAREHKIELTRKNLQDLGNRLREEKGPGVLANLIIKKINNQMFENVIVDGIRNPAEVYALKQMKNFFLVSVDAPPQIRFKRMVERNRESDPTSWEGFIEVDQRDKGIGESSSGQAVGKCMEMAEINFINDGELEFVERKVEDLYDNILKKVPRPSWDEYFMEICMSVAKRATCDRGKSGSIIVKDKQILVSGYVGSPVGLSHCDEVGHQMKEVTHEDGSVSQHCMRTNHAEQNAICQAAKLGIPIEGATVYCKMTPCSTCAKLIINSGIKRIVCEKRYHRGQESEEMFREAGIQLDVLNEEVENYKNQ
jgi:dCMP deaminase